jgi:hypothetical protein
MFKDILKLSDVGLQAMVNASAGGLLVDATSFKFGSSNQNPNKIDMEGILGDEIVGGTIHHVEVHSKQTALFVLEIPGYKIPEDVTVFEVGVYLSSGILLGRAVFETPYVLAANETVRFHVYLVTNRGDLTTLNVTVGDHSSIPTTPEFEQLQAPADSLFNVISVLNGKQNPDGSYTPVIAMKYSGGPYQWGFTDHSRIFFGNPSSVNGNSLTFPGLDFGDEAELIVHVVEGSGIGHTRSASGVGTEATLKSSISGLSTSSIVAVWLSNAGASIKSNYPDMEGIPSHWVITRGSSSEPVWAPPANNVTVLNTLYSEPSTLELVTMMSVGTGDTGRFPMGTYEIDNGNYVQPMLGGVCQHKSAFDISANELEFIEYIDPDIPVELRMFNRISSNGARLNIEVQHEVGNGSTLDVELKQPVKDANHIKVYVSGVRQLVSSYTYDPATNRIKTLASISSGRPVEIRTFRNIDEEGYSTKIHTHSEVLIDQTSFLVLPMSPQSTDYVEVTQSGIHVHANNYTLEDNRLLFNGQLTSGIEIEVTMYDSRVSVGSQRTNLKGVVVDAIVTSKNLKLLRHGADPLSLPIPGVDIRGQKGIRVRGKYPSFIIESEYDQAIGDDGANFIINEVRTIQNVAEIAYLRDIPITRDMLLTVTCDFSAILGPGFVSLDGTEMIDFVVGYRTPTSREPDFGRRVIGSGSTGFNGNTGESGRTFGSASMTRSYEIVADNHPSKTLSVICKMRVANANIGKYASFLSVNVNISGRAKV